MNGVFRLALYDRMGLWVKTRIRIVKSASQAYFEEFTPAAGVLHPYSPGHVVAAFMVINVTPPAPSV